MIEDHCQMGRLLVGLGFLQKLPQHVAKALDRAHGQAIAFARQGREGVIGPENIA